MYWAAWFGHESVVRLLLADPRVDATAKDDATVRIHSNYPYYLLRLLLQEYFLSFVMKLFHDEGICDFIFVYRVEIRLCIVLQLMVIRPS